MQISDKLIKSCAAQNRKAQKQLYDLLLPYLRAVANRYLRDTSFVKDVLQESFIKIFKNLDSYDFNKAPIKQWAARITINCSINYNKRVIGIPKEEFVVEKHQTEAASVTLQSLTDEDLLRILKKMPAGFFEIFNLYVIDNYTHAEIAKMLNINESLSRQRLSRAKSWLKKKFNEKNDWLARFSPSWINLN